MSEDSVKRCILSSELQPIPRKLVLQSQLDELISQIHFIRSQLERGPTQQELISQLSWEELESLNSWKQQEQAAESWLIQVLTRKPSSPEQALWNALEARLAWNQLDRALQAIQQIDRTGIWRWRSRLESKYEALVSQARSKLREIRRLELRECLSSLLVSRAPAPIPAGVIADQEWHEPFRKSILENPALAQLRSQFWNQLESKLGFDPRYFGIQVGLAAAQFGVLTDVFLDSIKSNPALRFHLEYWARYLLKLKFEELEGWFKHSKLAPIGSSLDLRIPLGLVAGLATGEHQPQDYVLIWEDQHKIKYLWVSCSARISIPKPLWKLMLNSGSLQELIQDLSSRGVRIHSAAAWAIQAYQPQLPSAEPIQIPAQLESWARSCRGRGGISNLERLLSAAKISSQTFPSKTSLIKALGYRDRNQGLSWLARAQAWGLIQLQETKAGIQIQLSPKARELISRLASSKG